jgi:hypothetical protein
MGDCRLYPIDDDLSDGWLETWIARGLDEVEAYLARCADFDAFLDTQD